MATDFGYAVPDYQMARLTATFINHSDRQVSLPCYQRIPALLNEIKQSWPGTWVRHEVNNKSKAFEGVFIMLGAYKELFTKSLPVIALDAIHLSTPMRGILLLAVAMDANQHYYPLAFAVHPGYECTETWTWFIRCLLAAHGKFQPNIVFVSDHRDEGLTAALQNELPQHRHRFCFNHIMKNAKSANLTSVFIHHLYGVMQACSAERCAAKWADLKAKWTSKAHADFLKNLDPHTFANSAFSDVPTWGVTNNNIVESANSTFKAFSPLPIDRLIYDLVTWCTTKFIEHKEFSTSIQHSQPIIPHAAKWVNTKLLESPKFVLQPGIDYFVVTHEGYNCKTIVKAENGGRIHCECTCGVFKDCGLPCEHICAVAKNKGLEVFNCVNGRYFFEVYAKAYVTKNGVNSLLRRWR